MNTSAKVLISLAVLVVAFGIGLFVGLSFDPVVEEEPVGANQTGVLVNLRQLFIGGAFFGRTNQLKIDTSGNITGSSTLDVDGKIRAGSAVFGNDDGDPLSITAHTTLTAAQLCNESLVLLNSSSGNMNVTFPNATSTSVVANCFNENGDTRTLFFYNATSAANTVTFVTSTNPGWVTLRTPTTTTPFAINVGEGMYLRMFRQASGTIILDFSERTIP